MLKLEEPPCALQELGPNACDPEDLGLLLGDHTLAEVLDAGDIEERALYGLMIAGLVEAYAEPALTLGQLAPPEVEASAPVEPDAGMTDAARPELSTEERARDAESWFRKGESFLRGKRYDKAVEAFGMATHLDPSQGEYLFRRAIKLQPDCHAAHQEIRALNHPAESQGFMQRLLAWRSPASRSRS